MVMQDAADYIAAPLHAARHQPSRRRCQQQQSNRAPAAVPSALLLVLMLLMLLMSILGCDARAAKPAQAEERLIGEHAANLCQAGPADVV